MKPIKCVAFEVTLTGRRFYGCPVQQSEGVNCGVTEWVDKPWHPILQNCLSRLWDMYHEQNCGRVVDKQKYEKHLAKLKTENDKLCIEYTKLVQDVSKMFDWQDDRVGHMDNQKAVEEEEFEKKKKEVEERARLEVQMEKLKLAKEQRKAKKEVEQERDLLKIEKAKLEHVVNELLSDGHASKEKLEKIKAILDS
nr:uncharacterized protein LOC109755418 [Aegilops tauschii subsp. strangulata]